MNKVPLVGATFQDVSGMNVTDELSLCMKLAKEQIPIFKRKSKLTDLC